MVLGITKSFACLSQAKVENITKQIASWTWTLINSELSHEVGHQKLFFNFFLEAGFFI